MTNKTDCYNKGSINNIRIVQSNVDCRGYDKIKSRDNKSNTQ